MTVQTSFQMYYMARVFENLIDKDKFIAVYASSNVKAYPFQIAAADFTLHSPYQKGAVLCDESGMGKSYEAMLVIVQKWYERKKVVLFIPNADLLQQWVEMIETYFTVPYVVITDKQQWEQNCTENENAFEQEGILLTTYDFAVEYKEYAKKIQWDLTVFEEATALSSVYQADNKQAKTLKEIAEDSFKLLLTGTPIEKNIMDLYGLIYFIDSEILADEQTFLKRYLRQPENYPELAQSVSRYCFRTLKEQAKQYAKITNRIFITYEYELAEKERKLYDMLYQYCNKENKIAFPEMNPYYLTLKLLDIQGSSTKAILQTIDSIIKRIEMIPNAEKEITELKQMQKIGEEIDIDSKTKYLLLSLKTAFQLLKKAKIPQKAVIFTSSVVTQKYLYGYLKDTYKTVIYDGSADYSAIQEFKNKAELLLSTNHGSRGFNLEESAFVIHYDLLYNTLEMEQRIDRCHRLGQDNDVITLAFIDKNNYADVRKLELVNKRTLVTDGVFGITDKVMGGFTTDIKKSFCDIAKTMRTKEEIEKQYQTILQQNKEENKKMVAEAEDILFTTFTKKIADKVTITPQYIEERTEEINKQLWKIVKFYFEEWNKNNTECYYQIDEKEKTITACDYKELPYLFYYTTNSGNKRYKSMKKYGMSADFKPSTGRITLTSVIGRGILSDIACCDVGILVVDKKIEPCTIALYYVSIYKDSDIVWNYNIFVGKTQSGKILTEDTCKEILNLPIIECLEKGNKNTHWLRRATGEEIRGRSQYREMNELIDINNVYQKQKDKLTEVQAEEVGRIKLIFERKKTEINSEINAMKKEIKNIEADIETSRDRTKVYAAKKKIVYLHNEFMKKQEGQFFEEMKLDMEAENKINEFLGESKLKSKLNREFVLNVKGEK